MDLPEDYEPITDKVYISQDGTFCPSYPKTIELISRLSPSMHSKHSPSKIRLIFFFWIWFSSIRVGWRLRKRFSSLHKCSIFIYYSSSLQSFSPMKSSYYLSESSEPGLLMLKFSAISTCISSFYSLSFFWSSTITSIQSSISRFKNSLMNTLIILESLVVGKSRLTFANFCWMVSNFLILASWSC